MAIQRKPDGTLWLTDPTGARADIQIPNSAENWLNTNGFNTGVAETIPEPAPHPMSVPYTPDLSTAVGRYKHAEGQLDAPFARAEAQATGPIDMPLGAPPTGADSSLDAVIPEGFEPPPAPGQPPARQDFYNVPNFAPPPRGSNMGTALEGDAGTSADPISAAARALAEEFTTPAVPAQNPNKATPDAIDKGIESVIEKAKRDPSTLWSGPSPAAPSSAAPAVPVPGTDNVALADNATPPMTGSPGQVAGQALTADEKAGAAFGQDVRQKTLEDLAKSGQGSPGRPARDVLQSTKIERKEAFVSPETRAAYEAAVGQQMGVAQQTGEMQQQAHRIAGLRAAEAADAATARMQDLQRQQATKQRMLDDRMRLLDGELDNVRKASKDNPVDKYWARKGGFGTVMTKIGIALGALGSAVTGQPNQVYQQVRDEINDEIAFQKNFLENNQSILGKKLAFLGEMRSQMMSPEAAESATRALLLESAAQEATAQASLLNSEQSRAAGLSLAAKLQADALAERAKTELANEAVIGQVIKHYEAQAGSAGKPFNRIDTAAKIAKLTGEPFSEVYKAMLTDQYLTGKAGGKGKTSAELTDTRELLRRTVVIPPMLYDPTTQKMVPRERFNYPQVSYAFSGEKSEGGAPWARAALVEGGQYIRNLDKMIKLVEESPFAAGVGYRGQTRGELKNLSSQNAALIKQLEVKEALTLGEYEGGPELKNLTGEFALDTLTPSSTKLARLRQLRDYAVERRAGQIRPLMRDPNDPRSSIGEGTDVPPPSVKKEE